MQIPRSKSVSFPVTYLVMLRSVQLNDQLCFRTVEISNVSSQDLLSVKAKGITAKIVISEAAFFLGHFFSELSGKRNQLFVFFLSIGITTPQSLSRQHCPPCRGCRLRAGAETCPQNGAAAEKACLLFPPPAAQTRFPLAQGSQFTDPARIGPSARGIRPCRSGRFSATRPAARCAGPCRGQNGPRPCGRRRCSWARAG